MKFKALYLSCMSITSFFHWFIFDAVKLDLAELELLVTTVVTDVEFEGLCMTSGNLEHPQTMSFTIPLWAYDSWLLEQLLVFVEIADRDFLRIAMWAVVCGNKSDSTDSCQSIIEMNFNPRRMDMFRNPFLSPSLIWHNKLIFVFANPVWVMLSLYTCSLGAKLNLCQIV